jgi:serine/threonine-protein kinase
MMKTAIKKNNITIITVIYCCFYFLNTNSQTVTTVAGSSPGYLDGVGTASQFNGPAGVAVSADGSLFVADRINHRIRKISSSGVVTTFAGNGVAGFSDGIGTAAQFNYPMNLAFDQSGNIVVADSNNHKIRKITQTGEVTTIAGNVSGFADGTGTAAKFNYPEGVAVDNSGNVFVTDTGNSRIRKITSTGVVTTLAGSDAFGFADGVGVLAKFWSPSGIAVDASGMIFVAEKQNNRIRKITQGGVVTTFAGNGTSGSVDGVGITAQFSTPFSLALDATGNVFVTDAANNRIRKITSAGMVSTFAGSSQGYLDGIGTAARFFYPLGISIATDGTVFIGESGNSRIRKITNNLSIDSYQVENQITVYPNPGTSIIHLELNNITISKINIIDMNGRHIEANHILNHENMMYIGNLRNGIYTLQIFTDNGIIYKKIIKK